MVTRILSDNKELLRDLVEDESKYEYNYRAVRCVHAPRGSVVNFTAYLNFIDFKSF